MLRLPCPQGIQGTLQGDTGYTCGGIGLRLPWAQDLNEEGLMSADMTS